MQLFEDWFNDNYVILFTHDYIIKLIYKRKTRLPKFIIKLFDDFIIQFDKTTKILPDDYELDINKAS